MKRPDRRLRIIERVVEAMGSVPSLFVHTLLFLACFAASWINLISFDSMLLILTTLVSLEAIYLSLLIQMTVNENTRALREVEDDIDEIQEDVEELGEDIEEIQEDIEEISEDIDEMSEEEKEEEAKEKSQADSLDQLTADVRRILADLEALKKGK